MSLSLRRRSSATLPAQTLVMALLALVSPRAQASTPADTGLFAPVARQQAYRLERIASLASGPASRERVILLLWSGRVDEARSLAGKLTGDARMVADTRAEAALAAQDFATAQPLVDAMAARPDANTLEKLLRYAWAFDRDDAPQVDQRTRGLSLAPDTKAPVVDLLAAGRLAYDLLAYDRAESCFTRALERAAADSATAPPGRETAAAIRAARAAAWRGLGLVAFKHRDYDGSLGDLVHAIDLHATPDGLESLANTLIRLGRTDEAVTACEWGVLLGPYHDPSHYLLGNGYAHKNYTELAAAYPKAFADRNGRRALALADSLLAAGDRARARLAYRAVRNAHPGWADAAVRLASLDFEDARYDSARDLCFAALAICPEYGRAHAVLAKALESQRFVVDVHRADYEARFAAAPMPDVPGIERFVLNWKSLSPRHQKRVALSIAPWRQFIPVLLEGGSSFYIKPLYALLSECPGMETLRDTRIDYDSRLWDDVRGAGGFKTVTGIEDVERTIFDRYNTVVHELSHQVHGVMTADQSRAIQEHYRRAKERDDRTKNGFMSRYAGGSVFEYFAEGVNAQVSPRRDAYDPREVVRERLVELDPDLQKLVIADLAIQDVGPSYPVAYVNAGNDHIEHGEVPPAITYFDKALARNPSEESALASRIRAYTLEGDGPRAVSAVDSALRRQPTSGPVVTAGAEALWHGGRGLDAALDLLVKSRPNVRAEDRHQVDQSLGRLAWVRGEGGRAAAAFDSVLAYQSDNPEALWGKAAALALDRKWDEAFKMYDAAVRMRTGIAGLRCDYARDLLRAGRTDDAAKQLDEARLLDRTNATAEALRGWVALARGNADSARTRARRALGWGEWCDLARIVLAQAETRAGRKTEADAALAPVLDRIAKKAPPGYVYRKELSTWEAVHELPAVEHEMLPVYVDSMHGREGSSAR